MTMIDTRPTKVIGTPMVRREDPRLLTGEARFTDDLDIPGALHLAVVRSPYAHARIVAIVDALSHLGVRDIPMPASPQRVWQAIHDAQSGGNP